jgi:hypothetical protein
MIVLQDVKQYKLWFKCLRLLVLLEMCVYSLEPDVTCYTT